MPVRHCRCACELQRSRGCAACLPPVGPRKRNTPMGLLWECRPALARRTQLLMTFTAGAWPITRLLRACSIVSSFWLSLVSRLSTGMPV